MKRFLATLLTVALYALPSIAQNNIMGIDDECYRLYMFSKQHSGTATGQEYLEKLYSRAEEINDTKALAYANKQAISHYHTAGDETRMLEAAQKGREIALERGMMQDYLLTYSTIIKYYIKQGRSMAAMEMVNDLSQDEIALRSPYGVYTRNWALGAIYFERGSARQARSYFREALRVAPEELPITSYDEVAVRAAELYTLGSDSSLFYLNKAESRMRSGYDSSSVYSAKVLAYALNRDIPSYKRYLSRFNALSAAYPGDVTQTRIRIAKNVVDGNWTNALALCDDYSNQEIGFKIKRRIARMSGDMTASLEASDNLVDYSEYILDHFSSQDLAEISARFDVEQLKLDTIIKQNEYEKARSRTTMLIIFLVIVLLIMTMAFIIFRRSMELKEKQKVNKALMRSNEMKTNFVHNISHEIRTPLNAIMGFSQLLALPEGSITEEEREQYCNIIVNNGELLMMLVNDILSLSDVEKGRIQINMGTAEIHEIVAKSMESINGRVPDGVELLCESDCPEPFVFKTDGLRVQQIILNFLTNACKNTTKGSISISSSLKEKPGKLTIAVTDTGCGVKPEMAETIFERFKKLDEFKPGSGIGLNLCLQIATAMKCKIYLDTTYTNGARFVLEIPLN